MPISRQQAYIITVPQYKDVRGTLHYVDPKGGFPFAVQRAFWITDVPQGQQRGNHAHTACHELLVALAGQFEVTTDNGYERQCYTLNNPTEGLVIPAGVWCTLHDFSQNSVCMVLASEGYDETGYINDYESYITYSHGGRPL